MRVNFCRTERQSGIGWLLTQIFQLCRHNMKSHEKPTMLSSWYMQEQHNTNMHPCNCVCVIVSSCGLWSICLTLSFRALSDWLFDILNSLFTSACDRLSLPAMPFLPREANWSGHVAKPGTWLPLWLDLDLESLAVGGCDVFSRVRLVYCTRCCLISASVTH